ncbi:hypothetical protein CVT26_014942 [Gymnopilus dilepis]|uniref:Uncharacterized protein n=1 Tax=Gymnopilus dilepis TaxID=231916 RepID=A0A409XWZ6_9AGAR|nr:hypothetical protein CVT26_014942 [Gymnopilus dilepis]
MTDLKARIGPKVAPGHFPNQSWVRPGYEAKPSARRSSWQEERHGTQLHDSTTTNDLDFSPSQPPIPSTSSRPERSLFARMGIDDDARESPETEHVAKSLIERLDDFPSPAAALGSQRQPIDVDALDEEYDAGQRLVNGDEPTVSVKSEPIEVDIAFDDERAIAASICEPVIDVSHAAHSPESLMGGASFKNKLPTKNLRTEELESYNDLAPGVSFIEKGILGYGAGPPLPPRNPPDSDMSTTNHALLRPTSPGRKDSPGSGSEEGEVHEAFTEQVRGTVLPLMQRIAGQRLMESGLESSEGPTHMNTSVITNEVSASFIRHAKNVTNEVGFHDSTLSSEDMRRPPVLSPVAKAPAPNAGQAGLRQEDMLRRLSSRNANNSFSSPEALSPPLTSRSMRGDYARHSPPQAPPKERDSSPRYTPSPYKHQQSYNRGSTNIQTSPTTSEPGRKRQRSPSPDGYHTRRRAHSRGQPYATRPVRGREVHSPDTDSRRQFRKPHEYHSPPPDSPSSKEEEHTHMPMHLPCYNVPGLWFVKSALNDLGTLACDFEVDYETAQKWHIPLLHSDGSELHSNQQSQKNLSLQICAFSRQLVDGVMQNLGSETTPQEVAKAIFALPQSWPPAGHLIITVNPETPYAKTWLPYEFGPNQNPIQIEDHVSEGNNVVQFLQLSGMPDSIFTLFAAEKEPDPDVPMETVPLLPSQTTGVASSGNLIGVKAGTVTISS